MRNIFPSVNSLHAIIPSTSDTQTRPDPTEELCKGDVRWTPRENSSHSTVVDLISAILVSHLLQGCQPHLCE